MYTSVSLYGFACVYGVSDRVSSWAWTKLKQSIRHQPRKRQRHTPRELRHHTHVPPLSNDRVLTPNTLAYAFTIS